MCAKKGSGKNAGTPLSFRPGDMNYVQTVDVVFLEPVKNKRGTTPGDINYRVNHTECPSACSHSFIPNKLGTPVTVGVPLGIANPWAVAGAAGVFGRAVRLRVSRSFRAFCTLLDRMVR